ncbi:tigger transposable element-derived protein 7-like [Leptopilina heterotoma]|uniref:tigger transposable element-derived protein 7-like n=1 Tax=Leptopilina heterotoma TaxID=63436 RepID=UPI001CA8D286|nr:tigger transposable element-derived protein 7-like [Leptopilina heterotoma]
MSGTEKLKLLVIDNCPAHPKVLLTELKAIKTVHLPANTTSKLQPMDQGIIKNLKCTSTLQNFEAKKEDEREEEEEDEEDDEDDTERIEPTTFKEAVERLNVAQKFIQEHENKKLIFNQLQLSKEEKGNDDDYVNKPSRRRRLLPDKKRGIEKD